MELLLQARNLMKKRARIYAHKLLEQLSWKSNTKYRPKEEFVYLLDWIKKPTTVGVVGLPNIGKSSLLNSLKRSHAVNVGATPGLTRFMQVVQLDKNVKLVDCLGVVMLKSGESGAITTLQNCIKNEKLQDPIASVNKINL
ncbi:guanine nucleotide-binding protein-like NSN1 [Tanacetum coccineum]